MIKIYQNWEEVDNLWNNEQRLWEEIYIIIEEVIGGGARNPEEWGEMPYQQQDQAAALRDQLQKNLDKLSDEKKEKLIEVLVIIDEKKYISKKVVKDKKNIKITIDDIKLIANDYLHIDIEYLK